MIKKRPLIFLRLFGVKPEDFAKILKKVEKLWIEQVVAAYKRPGRDYKWCKADQLLMLLLYDRSYATQEAIGFFFGLDAVHVCRMIRKLEPILAQIISIPKKPLLSKEEIGSLIIDATESAIERPKYGQKAYYSGKKKKHTLKTEIRVTRKGRIIGVSRTVPGSLHDFNLFKEGKPLEKGDRVFADSGYQGIQDIHQESEFPYKKPKNRDLNDEEKEVNTALSKIRIVVENILGAMKVFRILSDRYRNKRKRYNLKFNIIAGMVNMKNGFARA